MPRISHITILVFLLLLCPSLGAQESTKGDSGPIELLHAGSLEVSGAKSDAVVSLYDSVVFRQDSTYLYGDRALWFRDKGQVVIIGNAVLTDSATTLKSDRMFYFKDEKRAVAEGNVVAVDSVNRVQLTAGRGRYERDTRYVDATEEPKLTFFPDSTETDTLTVEAARLEYFMDGGRGLATDSVKISKGDLYATCGLAEYIRSRESITLVNSPHARKQDYEIEGDTLKIFLNERKVDQVVVSGNAKATYYEPTDSTRSDFSESFITGRVIEFHLDENNIIMVEAQGNATSLYKPAHRDSLRVEENETSGDTLTLYMAEGQLDAVEISGGARGVYYSLQQDSVAADSTEAAAVDTVRYRAEHIYYTMSDSVINLEGQARIDYQTMTLEADRVSYSTPRKRLRARGRAIMEDGDTVLVNTPVLREGRESISGVEMTYNLDTKRGRIKEGDTKFEGGFYHGKQVRKVTDEVMMVDAGSFTSCDLDPPHYHFYSTEMKLIQKDKVFARPVVMYVDDLPVAAIPYYVFPIRKGRHSGFTAFELGNFEAENRFVRNLGYYWAISDYFDLESTLDYYEGNRLGINGNFRYALRYRLRGSLAGSYVTQSQWQDLRKKESLRWSLRFQHSQTLDPTTTISANANFISDKRYYEDTSFDPEEIRNRDIHSQASLSKKWENSNLTLALDQTWNLDTDVQTTQLPSLSYRRLNRPIFPYEEPIKKSDDEGGKRFYHNIYYSYSLSGINYNQRAKAQEGFTYKKYAVADHALRLSSPQNIGVYLTLTPALNLKETWYWILPSDQTEGYDIQTETFVRRGSYDASVSAKTTLYGTFAPHVGPLVGLRHVVTPTASFIYRPEYKKDPDYRSYTGRGVSSSKARSLSLGLGNLFQSKYLTSDGQERKLDLFSVNFATSYNIIADSMKWGNLSTSIRSRALSSLDLSLSSSHSFYPEGRDDFRPLQPRLVSFSTSVSYSIAGRGGGDDPGLDTPPAGEPSTGGADRDVSMPSPSGMGRQEEPWRVSVSYRYSEQRGTGGAKSITRWANFNGELAVTPNWRIIYSNRYDIEAKRITEQQFRIKRDLHCWEMAFYWLPTGVRRGYYLRINIKELPDIKLEKSEGGIRGY